MPYETDFHQAKGVGSAKSGLSHWLAQRVTAIALIPLGIWFVSHFIRYLTAPYEDTYQWLAAPWSAALALLFIMITFYHGCLGMQVIWEDYISHPLARLIMIIATKLLSLVMVFLCVVSILMIFLE